ncbi:MAG: LysR family transcriptional regulator [Desulfobacteraceae bacterium]|nr:MAG: LysR family transcriptional regulator [Desulfobacteraceae bacterium]
MEITHLKMFQAVAEAGSVSGAAERLHCVQSNVTSRIKNLEKELETLLFHRKSRGMILTPAGHVLLDYARQIIHLEKDAKQVLLDDDLVQGPLLIGAFESIAAIRLPKLLARYHMQYPQVELSLITGTSTELNKKVLDYEVEGAFVTDGYRTPGIQWSEAFYEELVIVSPTGNDRLLDAAQKSILVFPRPCAYRERLEQWLQANGLAPRRQIELGSSDGIVKCISAGMGISILPFSTVESAVKQGVVSIQRLDSSLASVPIMFVRRKGAHESKPLSAFLDLVSQSHIN